MPKGLVLDSIGVSVEGHALFDPITLSVAPGETVTVMGPSGSGKSTLLSAICGTLTPAFTLLGTVELNGRTLNQLPPEDRRVGILFQDDLLFPHLSVSENLAFGLPQRMARDEREELIEAALKDARLPDFGNRDPATLSGGQRARIACLRTLLAGPEILLLDEPFSKLDQDLKEQFRRFVFDHAGERNLPTLLVTHDPADAEMAGGRIHRLQN